MKSKDETGRLMVNWGLLPELEIRSGAFGRVHVQNIYNVVVPRITGEPPLRLTPDAWSAEELSTSVKTLKKRLDTLVEKAKDDEKKLRRKRVSR